MFRVDADTLRHITDHFVKEMEKGWYTSLAASISVESLTFHQLRTGKHRWRHCTLSSSARIT